MYKGRNRNPNLCNVTVMKLYSDDTQGFISEFLYKCCFSNILRCVDLKMLECTKALEIDYSHASWWELIPNAA
jgi:hypothetical protein